MRVTRDPYAMHETFHIEHDAYLRDYNKWGRDTILRVQETMPIQLIWASSSWPQYFP